MGLEDFCLNLRADDGRRKAVFERHEPFVDEQADDDERNCDRDERDLTPLLVVLGHDESVSKNYNCDWNSDQYREVVSTSHVRHLHNKHPFHG